MARCAARSPISPRSRRCCRCRSPASSTLAAELAPAGPSQASTLTVDGSGLARRLRQPAEPEPARRRRRRAGRAADRRRRSSSTVSARATPWSTSATLGASGTFDQLALTLAADGEALRAVRRSRAGPRSRSASGSGCGSSSSAASSPAQPLRLAQPAELTLGDARTRLAGLDLRLGEARLQASADLGPQEVSAEATLAGLPLALLGRFGGAAAGRRGRRAPAAVGRGRQPARHARRSTSTSLRAEGLAFAELPPARFERHGRARRAPRSASISRGEGVTEQPITLTAELPLVVRLDQFVFEAARGRPPERPARCRGGAGPPRCARRARRPDALGPDARARDARRHGRRAAAAGQPRRQRRRLRQRRDRHRARRHDARRQGHGAAGRDRALRRDRRRQRQAQRRRAGSASTRTRGFPVDLQARPRERPAGAPRGRRRDGQRRPAARTATSQRDAACRRTSRSIAPRSRSRTRAGPASR